MKNDMAFFQYASELLRANVGFASDGGSGTPNAFTFIQRTTSLGVRACSSPFVYVFVRCCEQTRASYQVPTYTEP
jgi:hypothetical protein